MGLQHYTQDMSKIPLKYNKKVLFYTKYTHPTLISRGTDARTDARTDGRTDGRMENIYSIFRDKLLLLGEHEYTQTPLGNIGKSSNSYCLGVARPFLMLKALFLTLPLK